MKKTKFICGALSIVLAACCLTACSQPYETGQITEDSQPSAVTDFEIGDVETHEPILPWQFEEGEEAENPYYKRTTDENGNNVYAVLKASNNQVAYLPMSNTVVYMGASNTACFFERTTNTYKLNGEDQTVVQFQLYVADTASEIPPAPAPEEGYSEGGIQEPIEDETAQSLNAESGLSNTGESGDGEASISEGDSIKS